MVVMPTCFACVMAAAVLGRLAVPPFGVAAAPALSAEKRAENKGARKSAQSGVQNIAQKCAVRKAARRRATNPARNDATNPARNDATRHAEKRTRKAAPLLRLAVGVAAPRFVLNKPVPKCRYPKATALIFRVPKPVVQAVTKVARNSAEKRAENKGARKSA